MQRISKMNYLLICTALVVMSLTACQDKSAKPAANEVKASTADSSSIKKEADDSDEAEGAKIIHDAITK